MKAKINGKTYDTETEERISAPDGDDALCRTASGDYFLVAAERQFDGRKLQPALMDVWEAHGLRGDDEISERKRRGNHVERIIPLTKNEAMDWVSKELGRRHAKRTAAAVRFIWECEEAALGRLKRRELSGDDGKAIGELAKAISFSVRKLVEQGDVMLARGLAPIFENIERAWSVYGEKVTGTGEPVTIEQLLNERKPHALLAMFEALHPDASLLKGQNFKQLPEDKLRALLLSKESWPVHRDGKEIVELRKHRLSQVIEQIWAARGQGIHKGKSKISVESARINVFVESLRQGWFWNNGQFKKCDWHGKKDVPTPALSAAQAGTTKKWSQETILPFLKRETGGDPMKLTAFDHMLAARKAARRKGEPQDEIKRLAQSERSKVWNQIRTELEKAWLRMAALQARRGA